MNSALLKIYKLQDIASRRDIGKSSSCTISYGRYLESTITVKRCPNCRIRHRETRASCRCTLARIIRMRDKQRALVYPEEDSRQLQLSGTSNLQLGNHPQNLVHASKELSTVKTRPTTPVLANDGGGGFWLATVAAGASTPAGLPPHGTHHPAMDPTCGSAETGFINSQPSMAEFMTALPQLAGDSSLQHSPGTGGSISPGAHHPAYHTMMDPHGVADPSGVNVPEYPWMKEKKTTRKSNQQGESLMIFVSLS